MMNTASSTTASSAKAVCTSAGRVEHVRPAGPHAATRSAAAPAPATAAATYVGRDRPVAPRTDQTSSDHGAAETALAAVSTSGLAEAVDEPALRDRARRRWRP